MANEKATAKALKGLETSAGPAGLKTDKVDPAGVIGKAIGVLVSVAGIIFLIIVVYGGVTWMTAAGAPEGVTKGRGMIIDGAIGLTVTMAAYAITYYVVKAMTSAVGVE